MVPAWGRSVQGRVELQPGAWPAVAGCRSLPSPSLSYATPKFTRIRPLDMSVAEKDLVAELVKAADDVHNAAKVRLTFAVRHAELMPLILS